MSSQMADPHDGMLSFQQGLHAGILALRPVPGQTDLFSHFDVPSPGVGRLTYVRLAADRRTVRAFVSCIMNGEVDGCPCVAVGYAIPQALRNQGLAKDILVAAIEHQRILAAKAGHQAVYVEAVVDVDNIPSQRVAAAVLKVEQESITDSYSGRPAARYTAQFAATSMP